jgi:hypothetical protein
LLLLLQVLQELTGLTLNDRLVIAISSITKMFVGELVETGGNSRQQQIQNGVKGVSSHLCWLLWIQHLFFL